MTQDERQTLIAQYEAGYDEVLRSLSGFTPEQLKERPLPRKWSALEIIHHLADSEMTSALRLRKLLTENYPVIHGYDEAAYAVLLRYNERDPAPSLEAFRQARATTAQLLSRMSDTDWQREGWHTEGGRYTAQRWLEIYAAHAHNHAAQIARLREALKNSDES